MSGCYTPEISKGAGLKTTWYKTAETIKSLVSEIIETVWGLPGYDFSQPENRYDWTDIRLVIDNDSYLNELAWSIGGYEDEDTYEQVMDAVRKELIRREELVFRNKKRVADEDPLSHLKAAVRGHDWATAKRNLVNMLPGYIPDEWSNSRVVEDVDAEGYWQRLYKTVYGGGELDPEIIKWRSNYVDKEGNRYVRRLSEAENKFIDIPHADRRSVGSLLTQDERAESYLVSYLFGWKTKSPRGKKIEIYRGVPRLDATLRPGDFCTTNRRQARTYMRGAEGKITRDTVDTDDLILVKIDDPEYPEFIYYPRAVMEAYDPSQEVKAPMTFAEFWQETNSE